VVVPLARELSDDALVSALRNATEIADRDLFWLLESEYGMRMIRRCEAERVELQAKRRCAHPVRA